MGCLCGVEVVEGAYAIVFDGRAEGGTERCFDRKRGGP